MCNTTCINHEAVKLEVKQTFRADLNLRSFYGRAIFPEISRNSKLNLGLGVQAIKDLGILPNCFFY